MKRLRKFRILATCFLLFQAFTAVWLVWVFQGYLPNMVALLPVHLIDQHLRRSGAYDVLLVLWFAAVAHCAGRRFLRILGLSLASGAEEATFSIAAGVSLFSWITMVLALLHGLYRPVAYALLLVPTVLWGPEMRKIPGDLWHVLCAKVIGTRWSARSFAQWFLVAYIAVVLAIVLLSALGPSYEYDDLAYHLAGPKNSMQHHRLVPLPDIPLAFFPKNIEMLFTLGLLWHCDITAKLLHFVLGVVAMSAVYAFSARVFSRTAGLIAAAILASSPLFIWEMRTAHNDVALALYVFVGAYAASLWLWTGKPPWLRLAVLFFAFGLGIKYYALLALGVTALLAFAVRLRQARAVLPAARSSMGLILYSTLGLLPWAIINLYYTGNPLFPLLNGVFRSPHWTPAHMEMMIGQIHSGGVWITLSNWWELFALWWKVMADQSASLGGNIGPFYVMLTPLLLFRLRVRPELRFMLASSLLYYVGWAVSGPFTRYLLPALPGLAAVSACATVNWLRLLVALHRTVAITASVLLAGFAVLSSPYFESYGAWARYGSRLIETLHINYLIGRETKSDLLARLYPSYRAVQYLNSIQAPKKVFYVEAPPDGFYLDGQASYHYSPFAPSLNHQSADSMHRILRQNGVTHLLVAQINQHTSPLRSRESDFTHRYLGKLYQNNAHIVYELLPRAVAQDSVAYDFLGHLEEARTQLKQPGMPGGAYREVRTILDDSRYCMVTTPPAEAEFTIGMQDRAVLSFAVGKANPACTGKGSFQVWISSPEGSKHMVYRRDLEGESATGWVEEQVDLAEYAGRLAIIAFKTEEISPCCDYLWADPVLIARSNGAEKLVSSREAFEHGKRNLDLHPLVARASIMPGKVKIGGTFNMTAYGPSLPHDSYLDIRYRAPGNSVEDILLNWQQAISSHTVTSLTRPGTWIITGVRAHRDPSDHEGDFDPVWVTLEVTP